MEVLTARQEEFLLLFASLSGEGNAISDASSYFEVSKATVSTIVKALTENDMINKEKYGSITLSKRGENYITKKLEQTLILSDWLQNECKITPLDAEKNSRIMVTTLPQEVILGIISNIDTNEISTKETDVIEIKREKVDFDILKLDESSVSMGDAGFEKPALLKIIKDEMFIVLTPKKIEYRPDKRRTMLRGKLERLWYNYNDRWHEVTLNKDGSYYIPIKYFEKDTKMKLHIRARASVGIFTMPESEAVLVFEL